MTIHKCDICGKEMGVWIDVKTSINSTRNETNVANLLPLVVAREYCPDCTKKLFKIQPDAVNVTDIWLK